uniref:Uncharacterized protein n=1 Tax=Oryza sativa subsp. japonica TaxID=39947 RepID=Q10GE0_ORYSJ|nr:hypothetical protein LOC_Os03g43309 [Oryza sativa Japonica Group]
MTEVYKENGIEQIKHWLSQREELLLLACDIESQIEKETKIAMIHDNIPVPSIISNIVQEGKNNFEEKKNEAPKFGQESVSDMNPPLNMEKYEKPNGLHNVDAIGINSPNVVLNIDDNIQEGECCALLTSKVKSRYHFKTYSFSTCSLVCIAEIIKCASRLGRDSKSTLRDLKWTYFPAKSVASTSTNDIFKFIF